MLRRILTASAALLGCLLLFCSPAFAYSTPSGLGSWPNRCPPWPADGSDGANTMMEQELANLCLAMEDGQAAEHTDLSQLDTDLGQVKAAVNGLTANSTTLDTLHGDLGTLDGAVNQLDSDLKAQPPSSTVDLGSGTMAAFDGEAQSNHDDLWVLIGVIVGVFCLDIFLRKVWP